jgi:hypothetical protein
MVLEIIRWWGGWSGRAKLSGGQESLRAKGLSGCHSSERQPRQPDRGPEGQIKRATLMTYLLKEQRAKGSSTLKHQRSKRQPAKEKALLLKGRNAYSRLQKLLLQKVRVVKLMRV